MASNSTDYLRFSAYSLKELITRKLASETKFTDQVYEGSNLAVLIDIVCYMYQCMLYNLNSAASEAMWSDTKVYENINRLAKLVGYCPKGATPATAVFTFTMETGSDESDAILPRYSLIDTKQTDDNGKKIYYSTVEDTEVTNETDTAVLFYNGCWKLYQTVYVASGDQYQTLILEQLTSDDEQQTYVSSEFIHVYVLSPDGSKLEQWTRVDQGLFTDSNVSNGSYIYSQSDTIYNVRLNESKQYEITFGNGFTGKMPQKGSSIYVFYLDSNGPLGSIDMDAVQDAKLVHSAASLGISQSMYDMMFTSADEDSEKSALQNIMENAKWHNIQSSTVGTTEESVDDIRRNAPEWFKTGNRLVTTSDWEYYVKNRFKDNVLDVVCQNNWAYVSTFYRWLYNLGSQMHYNPLYYLTKNRLLKYDYKWADAADVNNVYLWIKTKNGMDIYKSVIDNDVKGIKVMTQEAVYLTPLDVKFMICAQDVDEVRQRLKDGDYSFDGSYLEVTLDDNTLYANTDIASQVAAKITSYFSESNFTLGATVNSNDLTNSILDLGVVSRVRTVYKDSANGIERIYPGITFASWTSSYIDIGDDVEVTTVTKTLEPFQFPSFLTKDLTKYIKVIRKSIGQINTVQY